MLKQQEFRQNYHKKTNIIKNYNNKNRQNTHKKKKIRENPCKSMRKIINEKKSASSAKSA